MISGPGSASSQSRLRRFTLAREVWGYVAEIRRRIETLQPTDTARWGLMSVEEMVLPQAVTYVANQFVTSIPNPSHTTDSGESLTTFGVLVTTF